MARVPLNGVEYVRINLAELYPLCREAGHENLAGRYVVRGMVKRDSEPGPAGASSHLSGTPFSVALPTRSAMGVRVAYDHVGELSDGQWIEVYGRLRGQPEKLPDPALRIGRQ